MKNQLSKILAMVIAILMVVSMFSFAAFAAEDTTGDVVATPDEPVVELNYYLVGYINGADYGIEGDWSNLGDYLFVDGKVTVELTQASYVIVKDENGVGYWTDGWQGENPGTVQLGEFGSNDNKMHVAAGNVEFTFDAATLTLTATPVVDEPVVETPDEPTVETPDEPAANIYGDVDLNGKVNVKDATLIQKVVAGIEDKFSDEAFICADANIDVEINIKDATIIQKFVAGLSVNTPIGQPVAM